MSDKTTNEYPIILEPKWKEREIRLGEKRIVRKFCIFPKIFGDRKGKWFSYAHIVEEIKPIRVSGWDYNPIGDYNFVEIDFATEEEIVNQEKIKTKIFHKSNIKIMMVMFFTMCLGITTSFYNSLFFTSYAVLLGAPFIALLVMHLEFNNDKSDEIGKHF